MSTLRPGQVSKAIRQLRDAALKEMDAIPTGQTKAPPLKFDKERKMPEVDSDAYDSWPGVSQYPGQNSEHVGNGSGGVR